MSTRMAKWSSLHKSITYLSTYLHAYMYTYMRMCALLCVLHVMRVTDLAHSVDRPTPCIK